MVVVGGATEDKSQGPVLFRKVLYCQAMLPTFGFCDLMWLPGVQLVLTIVSLDLGQVVKARRVS